MIHKREYTASWNNVVKVTSIRLLNLFVIIILCLAVKYSDLYLFLLFVIYIIIFIVVVLPNNFWKWTRGLEWLVLMATYLLLAWIKYFLINKSTVSLTVYSFKFDVQLLILYPLYAQLDVLVFISLLLPLRDVYFFLQRERDEKKVLYGWEGMSFEEAMLRVCHKESNLYQDCQQFCLRHRIVVVTEMDQPSDKTPLI